MFTIYPNFFVSQIFEVPEIYYSKVALLNISVFIFLLSLFFGFKLFQNWKTALFLSTIKSGLFFFYFFFFFNKTNFNEIDSLTYIEGTKALIDSVISLDDFVNFNNFRAHGGGHYFYYIYSFLLAKIFGSYIFVPIAFNVLSTYFGGYLILKILSKYYKINNELCKLLTVIFLLHWENIFWSSFFNLRDILIQTVILLSTYNFIKFIEDSKNVIINFCILLITFSILFILRVHIAIGLYALFIILYFFIKEISAKKILGILLMSVMSFFYINELVDITMQWFDIFDFSYGLNFVKFFLSPIPFTHLYNGYGFLIFSMPINLILFPFIILGIIRLFKMNKIVTVVLVFVFFFISTIISGYENVQGPRQRLMVIPFLYIFQLIGLITAITYFKNTFNIRLRHK